MAPIHKTVDKGLAKIRGVGVRFSVTDVERLVALASLPARGRTLAERIEETLAGVDRLVRHTSADVFSLDPARDTGDALFVGGALPEKDLVDYVTHYRYTDPMGQFILGSQCEVKTLSDAASPHEVARTEFSELLGRIHVRSIAGWTQTLPSGRVVAIGLQRPKELPDYSSRERAVLALVCPLVVAAVADHFRPSPLSRLTRRERSVVELAIRGLADRDIAGTLGVGFATVRTHLQRAFVKFRVSNRTELLHAIVSEEQGAAMLRP
jgi:DNA-binding CsgD family transcriptional regulator